MANTLLTPQTISKEFLMQLENSLVLGNLVNKEYKKEYESGGVKKGSTVNVRKPVRFRAQAGPTRVNQDISEASVPITVDKSYHVSWTWSQIVKTLTIEEASKRYFQPAAYALAQQIDYDIAGLYIDVYNAVGAAGTTPAAPAVFAAARRRLADEAVQDIKESCVFVINPAAVEAVTTTASTGLQYVYAPEIVKRAIQEGELPGRMAGMKWYESNNIRLHTPGADLAGTVNGASQIGSSLTSAGSMALLKGDVFTAAGSYAVNPSSGQSTGVLRQFVATAATASNITTIYPSIITSGAYQTVDASPTHGGATTAVGTASTAYVNNLCFHRDAFALVTVPIEKPEGAGFAERQTHNGVSILVTKDFDINAFEEIIRFDILYGVKTLYPELAVRVLG